MSETVKSTTKDYAGAMLKYIERVDWVSFVELKKEMAWSCDMEVDGTVEVGLNHLNIVFWCGMSDVFWDTLESLIDSGKVGFYPGHYLSYLIDGGMLKLPLAKRPPKKGYKEPHWAPVYIRTMERIKAEQ